MTAAGRGYVKTLRKGRTRGICQCSMRAKLLDEAAHLRVTAFKRHFTEPEPLDGIEFLVVEGYRLLAIGIDDIPERNVPMPCG